MKELRGLEKLAKDALRESADMEDELRRFNRFFFEEARFRAVTGNEGMGGLLLSEVLTNRAGSCVGLAQAYLVLAERLGLPVVAAATPNHLFARWAMGDRRVNVELLEGGVEIPDSEYARRHQLQEAESTDPVFLSDMSPEEVAARIYNNRGVIFSREGKLEAASSDYARAIELDRKFPAPLYNRGVDRLSTGRASEALDDFSAALEIYPGDARAWNNRGLAHLRLGKPGEAAEDFNHALAVDPDLVEARGNLKRLSAEPGVGGSLPANQP